MRNTTPVIVGVGQVLNRIDELDEALEPLEMMLQALRLAEQDTSTPGFLDQVDSVRVVRGIWGYENPARFLAEQIGATDAQTVGTLIGGNQNQAVINHTAQAILDGELSLVAITGAENGNASMKARKQGVELAYSAAPGAYDLVIGRKQEAEHHEYEQALGIRQAIQIYPMYDNAIRYQRGESLAEHRARVAGLWSRFNDVARRNPNAWVQENMTADDIGVPSASNRPVSFPYTKFMNANMSVNMGAALIMCSVAKARALGIPEEKWVYPYAGVAGYDHFSASVRDNFYTSPGIRFVGQRLFEMTDLTADGLEFVDLYSCFPSAVQVAAAEYGFAETRDLTVTGGLTFGGGPLNNYVMHSIARMVELLRETPESKGLITANGGNLYKHVHGIYGGQPPARDFQVDNVQARIDALPPRECVRSHDGAATIESYTVMYGADGPAVAHVACRTPDDSRTWVNCDDADLMQAMTEEEFCGREVSLHVGNMRLTT
ncbi:MAG: acetyl-CoA acetyltransferase [Pseudomonadota bacterium]